jgi:hypothetical protein
MEVILDLLFLKDFMNIVTGIFISFQEVLPIFADLAAVTKLVEGEDYCLSSSVWGALSKIESVLAPHERDSIHTAAVKSAMRNDHFQHRVTLEKSTRNPVQIIMHVLDHRYVESFSIHFFLEK